jgi:hypothetical protein
LPVAGEAGPEAAGEPAGDVVDEAAGSLGPGPDGAHAPTITRLIVAMASHTLDRLSPFVRIGYSLSR